MPVNIFPTTALTVFEKQNFINRFIVPAGTTVNSFSITSAASPLGSNWNSNVFVTSDLTTSITIYGYYDNVFVGTTIKAVADKSTAGTEVTYTNFTEIPTNPYPYAFTYYAPDTRERIEVTVTINCNTGTTSLTQYVRNDFNYYRNKFIDLVHAGQVDARTNTTFVAPDLPLPDNINSDTLKNIFIFTTSLSTNIQNFNLMTSATAAGYDGTNALFATVSINPGVYVWTDTISTAAFDTGTLPSGVGVHSITIVNDGYIMGKGGSGGYVTTATNGGNGTPGGPAMNVRYDVTLTNNSYIGGGGGGGACNGGGGAGGGPGGSGGVLGGGGAGGAVGAIGSAGAFVQYSYALGGGGGRIFPGTGGAAAGLNAGVASSAKGGGAGGGGGCFNGAIGTQGSGGTGGAAGNAGQTGVGSADVAQFGAGIGGGGGGWGASGGAHTGNAYALSGGAGGKAINLNGYTVTYVTTGTIYGVVS